MSTCTSKQEPRIHLESPLTKILFNILFSSSIEIFLGKINEVIGFHGFQFWPDSYCMG